MRIVDCEQGSPEWLAARSGKSTASRMADVLSFLKSGKEGADRRNYRIELLGERLTGRAEEHYVSRDMENGTEREPLARASYEIHRGVMVDTVGFVLHPTLDFTGASPDGLVGEDGMIEIKSPRTTTLIRWIQDGVVPAEHEAQIQWNLACTGRQWCDFIGYHPLASKPFIVRMQRDEERIKQIEAEVIRFEEEIQAAIPELQQWFIPREAATALPQRSAYDEVMAMMDELVP